jgi:hypothetical protein
MEPAYRLANQGFACGDTATHALFLTILTTDECPQSINIIIVEFEQIQVIQQHCRLDSIEPSFTDPLPKPVRLAAWRVITHRCLLFG